MTPRERPDATALSRWSTPRLVAHIRDRYHDAHRRDLAEVVAAAESLERAYGGACGFPRGLAAHLLRLQQAIVSHQRREELALFPAMIAGRLHALARPLQQMEKDHDAIDALMASLRAMTGDFAPPAGACARWRILYAVCRRIEADLAEHMHIEDEILFPRIRQFALAQRGPCGGGLHTIHGAQPTRPSNPGPRP